MIKKNQSHWLVYLLPLLLFVMVLGMLQVNAATTRIECENMTKSGQYTGNISSPFTGVALYANNDAVSTTQNFSSSANTFALRGCSSNGNMARVDLQIDGQTKGTFYYGGSSPAVYTVSNVSTGTGSHTVKLICTADNNTWDAYVDYLEISDGGSGGPTPTPGGGSKGNVYLCFDDGPSNSNSGNLVNALKNAGCNQATMFVIGQNIASNGTGWTAYKNSGFSMQNHTQTHQHMTSWSYQQVYNDISACNTSIQNGGKAKPTKIRLPYLESNSTIQQACSALGLSIVSPNIDSQDWNNASTSSIISSVSNLQAGQNCLCHDWPANTVAAMPTVVSNLKGKGFGFAQY